ncbi:apolipoprotein N-acyltransferase [Janibacter sp. G56]|uniref:apolipoprotein N-acyltransferase n=1 Tax=Janibacter sp. G56 TaxID=3418717 RepID=UPI003D06D26B
MTLPMPPLWARTLLAVTGGLALWLSFPDHDLGLLAPVGVALISAALLGASARAGFGLGLLAGLACFIPTLSWSGIYVGRLPWFALGTLEALYVGAMGLVIAWVQRPLLRRAKVATALAVGPLAWVVQELARGTTPFGGFPWARLAFSQADTPLAPLAAWGGAPLITFAVAVVGAGLHGLAVHRGWRQRFVAAAVVGATVVLGLLVPLPTDGERVDVTLVQGNVPKSGLDFNAERRAVLDNHVRGTIEAAGRAQDAPDLVVWPENASDIDPLRNPDAEAQIGRALDAADAPLLIGAILAEPAPMVSNASLLYRPGASLDAPERYVKQHPVPFAEYIPWRRFVRLFSDKVDLVRYGMAAGDEPVAFRLGGEGEEPWFAIPTICFEVAYDDLMRESATLPGSERNLLVVQTNNATFGFTAESTQQFAISRIRAIEHGRSVAHVSTVGVSGFIAPDGSVEERSDLFTATQMTASPVVRSALTISDRIGQLPEALAGLALILLGAYSLRVRRADKVTGSPAPNPSEKDPARV